MEFLFLIAQLILIAIFVVLGIVTVRHTFAILKYKKDKKSKDFKEEELP
ncbi:MAG: hypothetical protein RBR07_09665 [Arcobacteraceae bacterium]|jgi:uncharacterized membrane protein|nr:hypothetical protein [Arcobacteraceae bacterium]